MVIVSTIIILPTIPLFAVLMSDEMVRSKYYNSTTYYPTIRCSDVSGLVLVQTGKSTTVFVFACSTSIYSFGYRAYICQGYRVV